MTENSKQQWSEGEQLASHVLLGCAILILFALILPTLRHGMLMGGDDPIHFAYTIELDRMLQETGSVFGWTSMYGFGAPMFVFRPPGFYLAVQLIHMLSLGQLPLLLAHKLTYALGILVYPMALFYLLRKFEFRPLVCGLGALLALAPISTWGHSIEAYYDLGLAKQVLAIPLFAFALGKLHGVISSRERLMPAACLFGCMFVCHPYMAWSFVLIAGLYLAIELLASFDWRRWSRSVLCAGAMVVFGVGLAAFWLVPFYMSPEIHPASSMSQRLVPLFDVLSETAVTTVSHFFSGSLFDRSLSPEQVFGNGPGTTVWSWRDNSQLGRLPLLTVSCIVGAIFCACRYRLKQCAFVVSAWLASFITFLGPDDVPLLTLIPFQQEFQYVHFVAILDMFTICLGAVGVAGVVCLLVALAQKLGSVKKMRKMQRHAVVVAIACLVIAPLTWNIYAERFAGSRGKLSNRSFELKRGRQTAWSLRIPQNIHIRDLTGFLVDKLGRFDRFYAHIPDIWHSPDVFHFSLAPAYIQRGNATAPVVVNIMGGVNSIFGYGRIQERLWGSDALLDLLRIRALVTQRGAVDVGRQQKPDFSSGQWDVYLRSEGSGPLGCTETLPIAVVGDQLDWESCCMAWVQALKTVDKGNFDGMPFLVYMEEGEFVFPLASVNALYVADPDWDPVAAFGREAWDAFLGRERPVFVKSRTGALPAWGSVAVTGPRQIVWDRFASGSNTPAQIEIIDEQNHIVAANLSTQQRSVLYFKSAYYRGWKIEIDGVATPSFPVSPGFTACLVEPGNHEVSFVYAGVNGGGIGMRVSIGTFLLLGIATFINRKKPAGDLGETVS